MEMETFDKNNIKLWYILKDKSNFQYLCVYSKIFYVKARHIILGALWRYFCKEKTKPVEKIISTKHRDNKIIYFRLHIYDPLKFVSLCQIIIVISITLVSYMTSYHTCCVLCSGNRILGLCIQFFVVNSWMKKVSSKKLTLKNDNYL